MALASGGLHRRIPLQEFRFQTLSYQQAHRYTKLQYGCSFRFSSSWLRRGYFTRSYFAWVWNVDQPISCGATEPTDTALEGRRWKLLLGNKRKLGFTGKWRGDLSCIQWPGREWVRSRGNGMAKVDDTENYFSHCTMTSPLSLQDTNNIVIISILLRAWLTHTVISHR